jgi:hypothetical protein
MFATYLGYWLMGALFVAVGMMGSMFTGNTTVAFILGALGCAALVFAGRRRGPAPSSASSCSGSPGALNVGADARPRRGASARSLGVGLGLALWLAPAADLPLVRPTSSRRLGAPAHFASFGEGVLRLGDIAFFVGGTAVALYLCSHPHLPEALVAMHPRIHRLIRLASTFVTAISLGYAVPAQQPARRRHRGGPVSQITKPTQELIASITPSGRS